MNRFISFIVFLIVTIIFIGCATTEGYRKECEFWIGKSFDRLIDSWGYPRRSYQLPNGNTVYIYEEYSESPRFIESTYTIVGNRIYGRTKEPVVRKVWCITYFEVDDQNIIIQYGFEGNNCVAME